MIRKTILLASLLAVFILCPLAAVQSAEKNIKKAEKKFVTVSGKDIISPDGKKILLRGVSLGNWLLPEGYMFKFEKAVSPRYINEVVVELIGPDEAILFWDEYYNTYITKDDIKLIKKMGCNSIRIPFNYRILNPENYPDVWREQGFRLLDRVIGWAKEEGLYVILDMHGAPGGQTGENIDDGWSYPWLFVSRVSQDRTIKIWRKIAERYKDNTTVLGYELLNEPIPNFEGYDKLNPELEPLYKRITASIREIDKNHIIILGGAQWNTNFTVFGKPFDNKLIYTFHHYWADPSEASLQKYLDFQKKYNVPLWLGESGENNNEWIETYRKSLERNQISWCFWPYKKMDSEAGPVSFAPPAHWNEIIAYADGFRNPDFAAKRKNRPSIENSREAFKGLLENIKLKNCRVNEGYLKALGLEPVK
ncbi:MAG: glycoside hydrolase family 5 protein [Firmicutes bacterium]|nr:glycoside hydrolase family 5 protein [Bacillota bacterium]